MEQTIYTDKHADNLNQSLPVMSPISVSGYHTPPGVDRSTQPISVPADEGQDVSLFYLAVKRLIDIVFSLVFLLLCFVPLLLLALGVALESPGAVIHKRRVLAQQDWDVAQGEDALQTFDAYKLRTMVSNADEILLQDPRLMEAYAKDWKLEDDPRITRLGHFLRTASIDELPQLVNVLKGEMTLIGPRMITQPELARYENAGPRLLHVKPGLTGLWQVSGRQNVPYEERVRLDMVYIKSRSLWFDFKIFFKTIKCVLLRQGAY